MGKPSVWGDQLDGRDFNEQRSYGMSVTTPPENYKWHHYTINSCQGNDSTVSELALETRAALKDMRLSYLDQFDLEIREEGEYRYWRWLGDDNDLRGCYIDQSGRGRKVVFSERRPIDSPLPKVPGLWPRDE